MIEVYIDGASAGHPGPSAAGVFINNNGELIRKSYPLEPMSNHEAEFHALLKALSLCKELGFTTISIRTDSKILDDAINNQYVKREVFRTLLNTALMQIEADFDFVFVKWIPSNQNREADLLAKRAIQHEVE